MLPQPATAATTQRALLTVLLDNDSDTDSFIHPLKTFVVWSYSSAVVVKHCPSVCLSAADVCVWLVARSAQEILLDRSEHGDLVRRHSNTDELDAHLRADLDTHIGIH